MKNIIKQSIDDSISAVQQLSQEVDFIEKMAQLLANCLKNGNKVIIAGNGGSLCDAAHFAEELTGFFRGNRPALPAIALTCPAHITCTGNDIGFPWIFSRGVEAYGKPGDVFIALTTSGNSQNLVHAVEVAKKMNLHTIAFLGKDGGKLKGAADLELIIKGFKTSDRVQEAHMTALHIAIEAVEIILFQK